MKLTEQDLQDACEYIMDDICRASYGDKYKELDINFNLQRMPITVRQIVDSFIDWLKVRHKKQQSNVQKV